VAKTHRMPGRAARGGALASELAARHRGRTPGPADFSEFSFPLRVEFLLKTDSGYTKDTGVTLFTLATPGNPLCYNTFIFPTFSEIGRLPSKI